MTETQAAKAEVMDALRRRFRTDGRDPAMLFGLMSATVGEVLADMIFSAAKNEDHADNLLEIVNVMIKARWSRLAAREAAS